MNTWVILLAAGAGRRLEGYIGTRKQFFNFRGRPLFWHSALNFSRIPTIDGMVFVLPPGEVEEWSRKIDSLCDRDCFLLPYKVIGGGEERQDSVRKGLEALPRECTHVLVHDAVRIFVKPLLIRQVMDALEQGKSAVVPVVPVTDTIKQVGVRGVCTLKRDELRAVQTPQGFEVACLRQAHKLALERGIVGSDDSSLVEEMGIEVALVEGDVENVKITHGRDIEVLREDVSWTVPSIGFGYDVHRYAPPGEGKEMRLGGVLIPSAPGIMAHSDGDVVVHSLMDAILGCLGKGDIGEMFPDNDPEYEDINSMILLSEVLDIAAKEGLEICHVDVTIVCEVPRLSPYRSQIRKNIARIMNLSPDSVNIKATTEEGMGFTGERLGIKVYCVVVARRSLRL